MAGKPIDLYQLKFWLVAGAAIVVITPLATPMLRKWGLACANAGFLWVFLGRGAYVAIAGAVIVSAMLLLVARRRFRVLATASLATALLIMFVAHKRLDVSSWAGLERLNPLMVAMGFSYVFLRALDLLHAVAEGSHLPPGIPSTLNYLLPFHMLAAGPIQSYDEFVAQPAVPPPLTASAALTGIERITRGLFKKYVLAKMVEAVVLTGFHTSGVHLFVEMQFFFIWLYLDFSAYSDVAVGIGRLLGVATPENFDRPYLARNMIDFWERWHVSLGQFVRRHVFTPIQLGLQRRNPSTNPVAVASVSFLVAFLLCGLWHEISLRYLAWGAWHATGLIACNIYKYALIKKLGRKGFKRYLGNRWIRLAAVIATYEYVAASLILVGAT